MKALSVGVPPALVAALLLYACGSSSSASGSCLDNPLSCPAGSTCWVQQCLCPEADQPCTAEKCTEFDLACLPSAPSTAVGQSCQNSIGTATCSDGEACVQEQNVDEGYGSCAAYCDPKELGSCPQGYECVEIGVALVAGAPVVNVCEIPPSDASIPMVGSDGGVVTSGGDDAASEGGESDADRDKFIDAV